MAMIEYIYSFKSHDVYYLAKTGQQYEIVQNQFGEITNIPLLENGLLVPVTGRVSAGPCDRH